jgi:hypothetical protein
VTVRVGLLAAAALAAVALSYAPAALAAPTPSGCAGAPSAAPSKLSAPASPKPSQGASSSSGPASAPVSANCVTPGPSPSGVAPAPKGVNGVAVALGVLTVLVLGGAVVGFVVWQRRKSLAAAYGPAGYTGLAGPPSQTGAGVNPFAAAPASPAPPRTRPPGQDEARLTHALRDVAAGGISPAVTQQVERLLARPGVSRSELVQAAIRHRDQLEGRAPRLARVLLEALRDAGVTETVVEGVRVDGQLHEVVGSLPAPTPALHDTVAETTQCGYVDGDRVLRLPKVLVYLA